MRETKSACDVRPTTAFDKAEVNGKFGRSAVIKKTKTNPARRIAVRLQGVDAPELHYQPTVSGMGKGIIHPFRQSLGETCADALHDYIASFGQAELPCMVVTKVNKPSDVCHVFGRLVGNLILTVGGSRIDINHWLLREGWVMPGIYNSMAKEEIELVLADHDAAMKNKRGLFSKKS
jgi:endonuclease YncB( thermonuclease family)